MMSEKTNDLPSVGTDRLRVLIDQYWSLAFTEGRENRNHDTEAGDAQRVSSEINEVIRNLVSERDELASRVRELEGEWKRCIDKWGNVAAKAGDFVESEDLVFHILEVHQNGLCSVDPSKPMGIKNDTKMTRLAAAGTLAVMASRLTFATPSALTEAKPAQPDCSGGMPCTDCPNKRKCQAGCMRQEEALERPNREEPSQRHPLDVEALHELQKVMADFGGDWPDVPGEQEVVRRAKMLSRLWKADRLVGSERIEAAAKVLAASMCYQWDSMLEEDRDTMRKTAEAIIRAASAAASPDQSDPDAWECSGCGGSGKQTAYDAHGFGHNLAYFVPCGVCDGVGFCGPDAARHAAEAKPAPKVSESRPVLYSDEYVTQQPEAPETGAVGWTHWEARIKQLMEDIGQSHSRSVYQAFSQLVNEATRLAAVPDAKPATQPICDGCGKTIPEHDALLRCKAEATQQASGEREPWKILPLSAEILHLDDDMLQAVLIEIRANVRAARRLMTNGSTARMTVAQIEALFQQAADADEEVHIRFARAVEKATAARLGVKWGDA